MQNLRINLKHLRYFWAVASHGSITKASQALHLTPQTISGQLRDLEESIGEKLFGREGRNLVLTETGRMVFSYADEMFQLGIELQDVLDGQTFGIKVTVKFGVAMIVPKLLAYRVLEPVLQMNESTNLICHEAPLVDLLADMSIHKLDAVLSDCPINPSLNIRGMSAAWTATVYPTSPSWIASSIPVTVTVCTTLQLPALKTSEVTSVVPSVASLLRIPIVTVPVGAVSRTTVKGAVPPASRVVPEMALTVMPAVSSSVFHCRM